MWASGFSPRITVGNWVDQIIAVVYLAGTIAAFFFGNLLAHPEDPFHMWNAFLFYSVGLLSWILLGAFVGFFVDTLRGRNAFRRR